MKDKIWISPDRKEISVPENVNPVFIFHMTLDYDHKSGLKKQKMITACTGGKFIHFKEQDYPKTELWDYDGLTIYFTRVQLNAINSFFTNGNQDTLPTEDKVSNKLNNNDY